MLRITGCPVSWKCAGGVPADSRSRSSRRARRSGTAAGAPSACRRAGTPRSRRACGGTATRGASRRWSQSPARCAGVTSSSSRRASASPDPVEHRLLDVDRGQRAAQHLVVVRAGVADLQHRARARRRASARAAGCRPLSAARARSASGPSRSQQLVAAAHRRARRSCVDHLRRVVVVASPFELGQPGLRRPGDSAAAAARPRPAPAPGTRAGARATAASVPGRTGCRPRR